MPESASAVVAIGPGVGTWIALAALALVLIEVGLRRRHRIRAWIDAPQRLLESPPLAGCALWAAVPLALVAIAASVPHAGSTATPWTAWLAALTLAGAGHLAGVPALGGASLLVAGLGLAAVPRAWFGSADAAAAIGLSLAALWMLWLAQFWKQQLLHGTPWTTTGRLIPAARVCAVLFTGGALLGALLARLVQAPGGASSAWTATAASSLQILLVLACWRRAMLDNNVACALAGGLAACAAALAPWIPGVEPLFMLALVSAAAVFLASRDAAPNALRLALRPMVMLLVPCIGVLVALAMPWSGLSVLGLGLIGLAAVGAALVFAPCARSQEPGRAAGSGD